MDLIPHTGELLLILAVAGLIFGLGRLPQLSYALAGVGKKDAENKPPSTDDDPSAS